MWFAASWGGGALAKSPMQNRSQPNPKNQQTGTSCESQFVRLLVHQLAHDLRHLVPGVVKVVLVLFPVVDRTSAVNAPVKINFRGLCAELLRSRHFVQLIPLLFAKLEQLLLVLRGQVIWLMGRFLAKVTTRVSRSTAAVGAAAAGAAASVIAIVAIGAPGLAGALTALTDAADTGAG